MSRVLVFSAVYGGIRWAKWHHLGVVGSILGKEMGNGLPRAVGLPVMHLTPTISICNTANVSASGQRRTGARTRPEHHVSAVSLIRLALDRIVCRRPGRLNVQERVPGHPSSSLRDPEASEHGDFGNIHDKGKYRCRNKYSSYN